MSEEISPVPKPESPVESDENIKLMSELRCHICGTYPVEVHHWKSRGSGGGDGLENLVSLCPRHHREFHDRGVLTFWKKYGTALRFFRNWKGLPPLSTQEE